MIFLFSQMSGGVTIVSVPESFETFVGVKQHELVMKVPGVKEFAILRLAWGQLPVTDVPKERAIPSALVPSFVRSMKAFEELVVLAERVAGQEGSPLLGAGINAGAAGSERGAPSAAGTSAGAAGQEGEPLLEAGPSATAAVPDAGQVAAGPTADQVPESL